jgi:hypothetical protein
MNKRLLGVVVVFSSALILAACSGLTDPEEVARIVSQTQTAMARQADAPPAPADTEPPPPPPDTQPPPTQPPETQPPEPPDRCDLFDPEQSTFVLHTIKWGDESFVMYVKVSGDVPGLDMPVEGDDAPWIYEGTIGGLESQGCRTYEGDVYKGRIYCIYPIDETYYNTAQPFELMVNGCDIPIASHPRLSLVVPEPEEAASSTEPATCTSPSLAVCGSAYEDYCTCLGMDYFCHNLGWGITYPACWPPSP